jgi:anti-sigma-K factor RskA
MIADSATGGYGTLYIGEESDEALLVVEKLPPTPSGKLYQIWLANGTSRVSAGLFRVDQSGSAEVMVRTTAPISDYQTLGITSESAPNGSQTPTGSRIIGCSLH